MKQEIEFALRIAGVDEALFDGAAVSVTVPSTEGQMTILAHHEPYITTLKAGIVTVRTHEDTREISILRGLLEISNGNVTVLT